MSVFDEDKALGSRPRPAKREPVGHDGKSVSGDSPALTGRPLGPRHVLALQRSAGNAAVSDLITGDEERESPVRQVVGKGGGEPMPKEVRSKMERSFGQDFSSVRLHTSPDAQSSAKSVQAKAYTVGDEIVLGKETPSLESQEGRRTLAHELTHVVQQRSGPVEGTEAPGGIKVSDPSDRFETEAERVADVVQSGGSHAEAVGPAPASAKGGASVQRDEEEEDYNDGSDTETADEVGEEEEEEQNHEDFEEL